MENSPDGKVARVSALMVTDDIPVSVELKVTFWFHYPRRSNMGKWLTTFKTNRIWMSDVINIMTVADLAT